MCVAVLDILLAMAEFARQQSGDVCLPSVTIKDVVRFKIDYFILYYYGTSLYRSRKMCRRTNFLSLTFALVRVSCLSIVFYKI